MNRKEIRRYYRNLILLYVDISYYKQVRKLRLNKEIPLEINNTIQRIPTSFIRNFLDHLTLEQDSRKVEETNYF